jgi:hypothetical protein
MARRPRFSICLSLLLLVPAWPGIAASIVDQVPRDALGFVLVRNLSQADAKIAKAMSTLRTPLPAPLSMIKSMTGVSAGLDFERDLLVVMLPPEKSLRPFHLAVWLPVKDYDALVRSLDGDPQRRIAAATIAGEDVLIAHVEDWAVVMDPDQRERLSQLASSPATTARSTADVARFIDPDSDVSLVVLTPGMQMAASWAAAERAATRPADDSANHEQGRHDRIVPVQPAPPNDNSWWAVWQTVRAMLADAQELKRLAMEAKGCGCSLRLDAVGNAVVKFRAELSPDAALSAGEGKRGERERMSAPRLYDDGPFVVNGSGLMSERWLMPLVASYIRQTATDLANDYGTKVDEAEMTKFRAAVERAVVQAKAVAILMRPGADQDGAYTNSFLAVRVASASEFLKQSKAAFDQWNTMLGKADAGVSLVFEESAITVDAHEGTEYSIDMAKAVGAPPLPETRQSMERLFGPGGRFRLQLVKVDEVTVLASMASEDQLAEPIRALQSKTAKPATDDDKMRSVAQLLAGEPDWRLYFSLDGYNHWLKRQLEAIVGPAIGGPIVRPFPESPPIGAAGGAAQNMVWAEVAVPADTLRGIGQFLHP